MLKESTQHLSVPPVLGTGDAVGLPISPEKEPLTSPRYWFIARVSPNTEKSTRHKLQTLGYEVFLASQQELRFWKNGVRVKKKVIEKVVITQYLFLHITRKERESLIRYSFIKEFMRNKASAEKRDFALMSDEDMETLMMMFGQSEYPIQFDTSDYTVGEEVLLHLGSYSYKARVVRKQDDKTPYYGIRISELGCAYIQVLPSVLSKL